MKKIMTLLLAAALSGMMLVGMTACNNNGGGDQNASGGNSVVNPFLPISDAASTATESTPASVASDNTTETPSTVVPTPESSVVVVEPSTVQPSVVQPSTTPVPTESDILDDSEPWDDDSDILDDSEPWDDDSEPWDDDSDPWEYSTITPTGTVNPAYAGTYTMKMDLSQIEASLSQISEMSDFESYRAMLEMVTMTVTLTADGKASATTEAFGESSSADGGSWVADGTTVYVTIEGSTAAFTFDNGKLMMDDTPCVYLERS